jgi:hypothetical protein
MVMNENVHSDKGGAKLLLSPNIFLSERDKSGAPGLRPSERALELTTPTPTQKETYIYENRKNRPLTTPGPH